MAKTKTWISNVGEVFEGTRAALMREYGIKGTSGFDRPAGAKDADGNRWKEEGGSFAKPKLYLGDYSNKVEYIDNSGKKATKTERHSRSETADIYLISMEAMTHPEDYSEDGIEYCSAFIKKINSQYELIDNRRSEDVEMDVYKEYVDVATIAKNQIEEDFSQCTAPNKDTGLVEEDDTWETVDYDWIG